MPEPLDIAEKSTSPTVWRVAVNAPLLASFDYLPVDGHVATAGDIGKRVRVPFGRGDKERIGVIVAVLASEMALERLTQASELLDTAPVLDGELLESLLWLSRYTHGPLGEVLWQAMPKVLRDGEALFVAPSFVWSLTEAGRTHLGSAREGRPKALLSALANGPVSEDALRVVHENFSTTARGLLAKEFVERSEIALDTRVRNAITSVASFDEAHPLHALTLNEEQASVLASLQSRSGFNVSLLDGVTGSGKTEVYLQRMAQVLASGKQVLVMVPEIGLTPQTLRRFESRLGIPVYAYHSSMSDTERAQTWIAARTGLARVVVGTRSSAFLPFESLGLIIVDEEHDSSFKQFDGIRFNARDFVIQRAYRWDVPVILGSATPSLESWQNAVSGRYHREELQHRAGDAQPPRIVVQDIRAARLQAGLSPDALKAIEQTLARGEQVLVFKNRRGYAPVLLCHDCGWTAKCTRCDASMTVHNNGRRLQCHHCGASRSAPNACPDCASLALHPQGVGTERIEGFLVDHFPDAPVIRVDRGTTQTRDGMLQQLSKLGDGAGILVGTQMLAKGHDLSNLTLVVVVGADEGLFSADFRANERLAQLLIQVAGRAGRASRLGTVMIQTHHPDHPLLALLINGGYKAFAAKELPQRQAALYPPFAFLALIRAEAQHVGDARNFLVATRELLANELGVEAMGPLPAPMPRRAGYLREQLLVLSETRKPLHTVLTNALPAIYALPEARKVRWSLDVDPYDLY